MKIVRNPQHEGVIVLELHGNILIGEGDDALRDNVQREADRGTKRLILDLQDVPYIDESGLGEIVRSYTTMARKGGKLVLARPTKRIQDLLAITKLLTVFEVHDSITEALSAPSFP
jgi:anti-sigma B factor antagonist